MLLIRTLFVGPIALASACSAQAPATQTAQAGGRESCDRVRRDRTEELARVADRVREIKAEDAQAERAGEPMLKRNQKMMEFQAELESLDRRYAARLAECSKS